MKKQGKILSVFAVIFLFASLPAFSQMNELEDLQDTVKSFSEAMAKSLPFYSTIGLNWSDAHIGQLLGMPPRFGFGFSAGATTMDIDSIKGLLNQFGNFEELPELSGFPLPGYAIEARIGGIILPFDIGLKFGYLNMDIETVNIDYMLFGGDFRYSLLDFRFLRFSVGVGFNHLKGGVSTTLSEIGERFSFYDGTNFRTLEMSDPEIGLNWETSTLEFKAQISFPLFIITPYAGMGINYAWSKSGYNVSSRITVDGGPITAEIAGILREIGITGIRDTGFESIIETSDWNMRLFGGLSLNLFVIKLDMTAMYNIRDNGLGATVGLRFQL